MKRNVVIAVLIVLAASIWLGYGVLAGNSKPQTHQTLEAIKEQSDKVIADAPPVPVRVRRSIGSEQPRIVLLRGKTENKRTVIVRAELQGKVNSILFERGDQVEAGQVLCELDREEHIARVREATDRVNEAKFIYQGRLRLEQRNLNSEADIAAAQASVAAAQRYLTETEKDLERSTIRAPFDGYVEVVHAYEGDLLGVSSPCATILDLDPMIIKAQVPETVIHNLLPGMEASATLPSGRAVMGKVTFLGRDADEDTRTFTLELTVPNPDYSIRSGLTAEIFVATDRMVAHKVNSSLFSLDDEGRVGVRIVDRQNTVQFYPVEIVYEEDDGVWVTGLPETITLITVGQRFVSDGQKVTPVYESDV